VWVVLDLAKMFNWEGSPVFRMTLSYDLTENEIMERYVKNFWIIIIWTACVFGLIGLMLYLSVLCCFR